VLLERPDEVTGKATLFEAVWPGMVAEEKALQVHISARRKALDTGMIMTVHCRGYKYAGPRPVLAQAAYGAGEPASEKPMPPKPSIAVLSFDNMSGDPAQDYISDGITENIITGLSEFRDLLVIASNSTFAYKGKAVGIQGVIRALGVSFVLEGSIQKSSDRIRVTAQLIDGLTGQQLWSERYDRSVEDIFAVQDDLINMIEPAIA
jgi:TolB-like protein